MPGWPPEVGVGKNWRPKPPGATCRVWRIDRNTVISFASPDAF